MVYYFILLALTVIPRRLVFYLETKRGKARFICGAEEKIMHDVEGVCFKALG